MTHAQLTHNALSAHAQLTEGVGTSSRPEVEVEVDHELDHEGTFSAAPKNRGLLRKRGHHIAAQVVTQGASLTSVQARAIHAGQSASPDFPRIARFRPATVHPENRSNEREARA